MARSSPLHTVRSVLGASSTISTAAVAVVSGYLGVLTVAALSPAGRRRPHPARPARRFAIFVPAHDEALAIARALDAFRALDYPAELFDVHVVADNCTDSTAEIVRDKGYEVHERTDRDNPGKGPALNWLHDQLVARGDVLDVVVIVDADTTLAADFLARKNDAFVAGALAAQGYYGVRDPELSATAGVRYAALACRHHIRPLGRTVLGGTCGLYGNGMAFDATLLRDRRWSGHLIEDAEFQLELLVDGHLVTYVPEARIEAEMPDTSAAATTQNERWELGRLQIAKRFIPVLARRSVARESPQRVAVVDAVLDQVVPPLSLVIAADIAATGLSAVAAIVGVRRARRELIVVIVSGTVIVLHVLAALHAVRAPKALYRSLASAPQMVLWKLKLIRRVTTRPDEVTWQRTARNDETAAR